MDDQYVPKEFQDFLNFEDPVEGNSLPETNLWRPWEQDVSEQFLDFEGLEYDEDDDDSEAFNELARHVFQEGGSLDSSNQDVIQANLVS